MKLTSDNETLAENKVLILYILNKIDALKYIFPEIEKLKNIKQAPDVRLIHVEGSKYHCKNFESI